MRPANVLHAWASLGYGSAGLSLPILLKVIILMLLPVRLGGWKTPLMRIALGDHAGPWGSLQDAMDSPWDPYEGGINGASREIRHPVRQQEDTRDSTSWRLPTLRVRL